jgi:hypothetical protein
MGHGGMDVHVLRGKGLDCPLLILKPDGRGKSEDAENQKNKKP